MSYTALLDANVLIPARVRDVLLTLADADLYRPLWSQPILTEVRRNLPPSMDDSARDRLMEVMRAAFPEAMVLFPEGIELRAIELVNAKDQHVVTAAVFGHADVVVTEDSGFRSEGARLHTMPGLDFQGCAEFTAYAVDVDRDTAAQALRRMLGQRWATPDDSDSWPRFLAWVRHQGWSGTASLLEKQ